MKTGIFQRTKFISKGRKTSRTVLGTGERAPCGLDLPPSRPPAALLRSVTARGERAAAETPARPALGTGGGPGPGLRHTGAVVGRGLPGVAGLARWWPQHAVGDRGWLRGPAERAGRCDGPRPAEGSVRRGWRLLRADRQCGAGPAVALAAAWEGPEDVSGSQNETQRQTGSRMTPAVWECGGPHCVCIRAVRTCYLPKKTE